MVRASVRVGSLGLVVGGGAGFGPRGWGGFGLFPWVGFLGFAFAFGTSVHQVYEPRVNTVLVTSKSMSPFAMRVAAI